MTTTTAVPIRTLAPGSRFALACNPAKEGTLLRVGDSGALVRYGRLRHVALPNGKEFDAQNEAAVTISLESPVMPITVIDLMAALKTSLAARKQEA